MIASTERGLLVTRFHYTRPVHPRDAVVTGLTTNAVSLRLTRAKKKIEREMTRQNPARAGHIRDESTQEHTE